jgi:hypothetical protein
MARSRAWLVLLVAALVALPAAATARVPVASKSINFKTDHADIDARYPWTGNRRIDATVLAHVRSYIAGFEALIQDKNGSFIPDKDGTGRFSFRLEYAVERNDAALFAIVFREFIDIGETHPANDIDTMNFLLPASAQVFLPEIVKGQMGLDRVSRRAAAILIKTIGSGSGSVIDRDSIQAGTAPSPVLLKAFVILPRALHLYFNASQISTDASAERDAVIPLAELKGVLRPDWRAPAPSFDCKRVENPLDTAICADFELARLERQAHEGFVDHLEAGGDLSREPGIHAEALWQARRAQACPGAAPTACLKRLYRRHLNSFLVTPWMTPE